MMTQPETRPTWEGLAPPYSTIVADPPWRYQKKPGDPRGQRSMAEHQYSTMLPEEIAALPVGDLAAEQAHLYLWITNPGAYGGRFSRLTPRDIVEAWGFTYVTMLTWVKTGPPGMGWYFRGNTEHVVFAQRGMLGIAAEDREQNVFSAPRGSHSTKPDAFFDIVERVSPGPRVELFARAPRLGWDHWGLGYEVLRAAASGETT